MNAQIITKDRLYEEEMDDDSSNPSTRKKVID